MNELLSEWAESRSMPAKRAVAIRESIVKPFDAAPGLGYAWWQDLLSPLRQGILATHAAGRLPVTRAAR